MTARITPALYTAAAVTFLLCWMLLRKSLGDRRAAVLAAIKVGIPLAYFSWYFDGAWTVLDDAAYYRQGRLLLASFDPISVFLSAKGLGTMVYLAQGYHFLYGWFNLLAMYTFGAEYWAPVFFNVALTCVIALTLRSIALDVGASRPYADLLCAFFLLHWEVLAWASMLNVKDIFVMALTVGLLRGAMLLSSKFSWKAMLAVAALSFVALWIRFYVPALVAFAYAIYRVNPRSLGWRKSVVALSLFAAGALLLRSRILPVIASLQVTPGSIVFGWLRTLLSPLPWSIEPAYGFLEVPSVLHFATLPLLAVGAYLLVRRPSPLRIAFIYAAILLAAVAAYPELQGPRHRIQILFLVAWAQFHGAYALASRLRVRANARPVGQPT